MGLLYTEVYNAAFFFQLNLEALKRQSRLLNVLANVVDFIVEPKFTLRLYVYLLLLTFRLLDIRSLCDLNVFK